MDGQVSSHREKEARLIDGFRWELAGLGVAPADLDQRRLVVLTWLADQLRPFHDAAVVLAARVGPIAGAASSAHPERFVARLDASSLTKAPESILEKMARRWEPPAQKPCTFDNFHRELSDLGRFRIIVNFLDDARAMRDLLEAPFHAPQPDGLSDEQKALAEEFSLSENRFEDLVDIDVSARQGPGRFYKAVFELKSSLTRVEVQIMTSLQDAWDKKEHVLVYEPRRRGERLPDRARREMEAMSDVLFIADSTFDRLRDVLAKPRS